MGTNLVVLLVLGLVVGETAAKIMNFHNKLADVARFNRVRRNSTHREFQTIPNPQPQASAPAYVSTPPAPAHVSTPPVPAHASASPAPGPAQSQPIPKTYVYVDYYNQYLGTYNKAPEEFGFKRVDDASEGNGGTAFAIGAANSYAVPYEAAQPAGGEVITVRVPSAPQGPVPVPLQPYRQPFPNYEDAHGEERDFHDYHHDSHGHAVYHAGDLSYNPTDFSPAFDPVQQQKRRNRPPDYRRYRVPYDHVQQS
uniref:Pollen-specific leucine-rich repeat extensin-like protein 2 n=1 Tax=Panagrellus redivivus TaxID=6233 RepID=A0A7E4ZSC4_PANRE